jgi:hypothetical protein
MVAAIKNGESSFNAPTGNISGTGSPVTLKEDSYINIPLGYCKGAKYFISKR